MKLKIVATKNGATGTALYDILFYMKDGSRHTPVFADVVSHNYTGRTASTNFDRLFDDGSISPYQPYRDGTGDLELILKVPSDIEKVRIKSYSGVGYLSNSVTVYLEKNGVYQEVGSLSFTTTLEVKDTVLDMFVNKILISSNDGSMVAIKPTVVSDVSSAPVMTGNTTPSGRAFASSSHASFPPFRLFDGVTSSAWLGANGSGASGHFGYEFDFPTEIFSYSLTSVSVNDLTQMPRDWFLEGSDDDSSWTVLDERVGESWSAVNVEKFYTIENPRKFKVYRLRYTKNNGYSATSAVGEFKLFSAIENERMLKIPVSSEQNFINYGMDKPLELDMTSEMSRKVFIEQSSTTLGSGKVFKKSIDTSQTPIKGVSIE